MTTVCIISAPSGSGKSTLVGRLLRNVRNLTFSVSYTTRARRGLEQDGTSYCFISREEFEKRIERGEFLEWACVFGNYYGTHVSSLERARAAGKDLVLDIDVQGARQLKSKIPDAVSIFILAPSRDRLAERLRARGEDAPEVVERRLNAAAEEIRRYKDYDYVLVNDELEKSERTLESIVLAERTRRTRVEDEIQPILESFGTSEE
jgi:guanylate kinase